ncbi:MAG: hypothetical protein EBR09_03895 [Proteobacteria bacterium]|nr:hypothetical protein [Pseudomonadota bacterium]
MKIFTGTQRTFRIVAGLILIASASLHWGCTRNSGVKSIRSDDWFRSGVDRFYLATVPVPYRSAENPRVYIGQEILVGVGCFGEPRNPAAQVTIPDEKCASKTSKVALNERIRLQDFPMAANPSRPSAGECVLLLGPEELVKIAKSQPEKLNAPAASAAAVTAAVATNACGLSLALGTAFFVQKSAVSGAIAGDKEGVAYARKMLNYFGENNLIPSFLNNEHPVYALKTNESLQGKSPEELQKLEKILVGQAVLPCSVYEKSVWELLGAANRNDVRKVFFAAMAEADRRTSLRVRQGMFFGEFSNALQKGQLRSAAAIYNPIFAYEFNRNVDARASQGWGGFGVQKFFDEIRKINSELASL